MSNPSHKPAERRHLPPVRPSQDRYEVVFPRKPPAVSALSALFGALRGVVARGGEAIGDAYAAGARVVLERKEALEDLNAERRHGGSGPARLPAPARDPSSPEPRI